MLGILRSLIVIVAAAAVVGGGTYSFFSTTDTASGNTITAGTLSIDILNQNDVTPLDFDITGILPGETRLVNFDVKNTSTTDIHLRGAAFGAWDNSGSTITSPDNSLIEVAKVEHWNGASWAQISTTDPVTGIFYYSLDGTDTNLIPVPAGDKAQFQLTVRLKTTAGDDYQGEVYNASIVAQGRQATATSWPADLSSGF